MAVSGEFGGEFGGRCFFLIGRGKKEIGHLTFEKGPPPKNRKTVVVVDLLGLIDYPSITFAVEIFKFSLISSRANSFLRTLILAVGGNGDCGDVATDVILGDVCG